MWLVTLKNAIHIYFRRDSCMSFMFTLDVIRVYVRLIRVYVRLIRVYVRLIRVYVRFVFM